MTAAPSPSRLADVAGGLAVAALLLAVHSKSMMVDVDVFHEMALYRAALRDGAVPTEDQFAYTPTVSPCVHHEWGTGLVLYHATASFGAAGLVALRYALTVALCLLLLTVLRRQGGGGQALLCRVPPAAPLPGPRRRVL